MARHPMMLAPGTCWEYMRQPGFGNPALLRNADGTVALAEGHIWPRYLLVADDILNDVLSGCVVYDGNRVTFLGEVTYVVEVEYRADRMYGLRRIDN